METVPDELPKLYGEVCGLLDCQFLFDLRTRLLLLQWRLQNNLSSRPVSDDGYYLQQLHGELLGVPRQLIVRHLQARVRLRIELRCLPVHLLR